MLWAVECVASIARRVLVWVVRMALRGMVWKTIGIILCSGHTQWDAPDFAMVCCSKLFGRINCACSFSVANPCLCCFT